MEAKAWESIEVGIAKEACALHPNPACYSTLTFQNRIWGKNQPMVLKYDLSSLELNL